MLKIQEERIQTVRQKIARTRTKLEDDQEMIDSMEKHFGKTDPRTVKARKEHSKLVRRLNETEIELNDIERDERMSERMRKNFTKPESA